MSSTILTNWTVYYADDQAAGAGMKQIRWTGAGTPETTTNTVNELYSALMDLFSINAQNNANDTTPMRAITPSVYEIGAFDTGDLEPWFIDPVSLKHLTGGSLNSVNWDRDLTTRTGSRGIVRIPYSGSSIVVGDIGATITNTTAGDTGTLLYIESGYLWIRPTDGTSANDWDSTGTTSLSCNTHTSDSQTGAGTYGERVWANLYTIGSIYASSTIYVTQNYTKLTSWWSTGHIDRLFLTNDGYTSDLIDSGLLTVYAREYGYLYDHFQANVSSGGRNPIPLATSSDINNSTSQVTINALTGITFTYTTQSLDISNGNGSRPYDVTINCGGNTIKNFYEYTKNVTRRTSTTSLNGHDGEQYWGTAEIYLTVQTSVAFAVGDTLTGATSGATGVIVANHTYNPYYLALRDVRGTFQNAEVVNDASAHSATTAVSGAVETVTLSKVAPFGTFAGTKFYGARGVHIHSMAGGDSNNYSLVDSSGTVQAPPISIPITVGNTQVGDRVSVFRAQDGDTSGNINTTYLTSDATGNLTGETTFVVQEAIPTDTPTSGVLRVVDNPGERDHRFRYASWDSGTKTFTLVTSGIPSGTITSAANDATKGFRADNANLANILAGDIVINTTDSPNSWAHVISVTLVSGTTYDVVHTPLAGGTNNRWTASDGYEFNTLPVDYTGSDTAYVPYIEKTAISTTTSTSVQYAADRNITARVRIKGMQPYINNVTTLDSTGYSTSVTRIPDTIAT